MFNKNIYLILILCGLLIGGLVMTGCDKEQKSSLISDVSMAPSSMYQQVNLVSDTAYPGARIDPLLLNAWGIAMNPTGIIWISANHSSVSAVYNAEGAEVRAAVTIPGIDDTTMGAPSGIVHNSTMGFMIPGTEEIAKFIWVGEDGVISAWASGPAAIRVRLGPDENTVYKGVTMAKDGPNDYLYAANFKDKRVDVYDKDFNLVPDMPFNDPEVPANFGPFNIVNIDGKLWVSYAMPKPPDFMDDSAGPGMGYVAIFNPNGKLVRHFYSEGVLNSPWGITKASEKFGKFKNMILIGNFGDGKINAFLPAGIWLGALKDEDGNDLVIDGLWAITFGEPGFRDRLYFTAGPEEENHGLFGYLMPE